jgi:hypothetical protein
MQHRTGPVPIAWVIRLTGQSDIPANRSDG